MPIPAMRPSKKTFHIIHLLGFLLTWAWALPTYVQSSYLEQFVSVRFASLYLTLATMVTMLVIFSYPHLIRRYSNFTVMLSVLVIEAGSLLALALAPNGVVVLPFFTAFFAAAILVGINIDVFLEDISDNDHMGRIRTGMMTVNNVAWVLSPMVMGWLAAGERYRLVYLVGAAMVVPAIALLIFQRRTIRDHYPYRSRRLRELLNVVWSHPDVRRIFALALVLRFFYALMVFYIPLHLHDHLGFSWIQIGWIFTIMLLPFLVLQLPAGRVADKYLGEKEILVAGLLTMMVFTGLIYFLPARNPVVWAAVLFMTRVGAALVEAMEEIYFFKHISRRDVDLINLFRNLVPLGWLLGSVVGVLVLSALPIPYLFLLLAMVLMAALKPALTLRDDK